MYAWCRGLPVLLFLGVSQSAYGFAGAVWGYVKQYQVGVDYTNSWDSVSANYETDRNGALGKNCEAEGDEADRQRCRVHMNGGASSGWGLFLQQAFKRQGTFYFKPDVGFGVRYLQGRLQDEAVRDAEASGLPLERMEFSLLAVIAKPYIQFGITPAKTWPDLLLSLGPAVQVATGRVRVNDKTESVVMATSSGGLINGFYELELVFWRFGEGALSVFNSQDFTGSDEGTKFFPKSVDGMTDIRANFSRSVAGGVFGLGLKILLNWP